MTDSNMTENATAEARRGDEALEAAKHLLTAEFFNDAISRAYYAAYHWSRALLFLKGLEPKTHRGVIQMIGLHYVKDGPLSDEAAALLASQGESGGDGHVPSLHPGGPDALAAGRDRLRPFSCRQTAERQVVGVAARDVS